MEEDNHVSSLCDTGILACLLKQKWCLPRTSSRSYKCNTHYYKVLLWNVCHLYPISISLALPPSPFLVPLNEGKKPSQLVNRLPLHLHAKLFSLCCCADGLHLSAWLSRQAAWTDHSALQAQHHWASSVCLCVSVCVWDSVCVYWSSVHYLSSFPLFQVLYTHHVYIHAVHAHAHAYHMHITCTHSGISTSSFLERGRVPNSRWRQQGITFFRVWLLCNTHWICQVLSENVIPPPVAYSMYSVVEQRSKALHLSARGITTDTLVWIQAVSQPGRDWESHRAVHNWPSVVRFMVWPV